MGAREEEVGGRKRWAGGSSEGRRGGLADCEEGEQKEYMAFGRGGQEEGAWEGVWEGVRDGDAAAQMRVLVLCASCSTMLRGRPVR